MSAHALKRIAPKRISFAAAVTKYGDDWRYGVPLLDCGAEALHTHDHTDLSLMKSMERGITERVYVSPIELDAYPLMDVGEHGFGYCATRDGYDGAPDSHCPLGIGLTKFEAIKELIEQECES